MSAKSKLTLAAALFIIILFAILRSPLVRQAHRSHSAKSINSSHQASSSSGSLSDSSRTRRPRPQAAKEWKLPFRLNPRLTAEQLAILDGDPASHLRAHPEDTDVLIGWASRDPDAAIHWLNSAGNITVNDIAYYNNHLSAICAGLLAYGGMEEMQAYLKEHEQDPLLPPKYQDGAFNDQPWYFLAREDTAQEAIAYLKNHPEETNLAGAFISGISDTRQMLAAMDYFQVKGIESNINYHVLRNRMNEDTSLFADWAATSRPDMLDDILLSWHSNNPQQLQQWIDTNAGRPELAEPIKKIRNFITSDAPPSAADDDSGNDKTEREEGN